MYKIHLPHREAGYIIKVDYQETVDPEGNLDWEILYTPGAKAMAEYQAFTNRQARQPMMLPAQPAQRCVQNEKPEPVQTALLDFLGPDPALLAEMTRRGITQKKALDLLANVKAGQEILDQLEYTDFILAEAPAGKFHNPPGLYIRNIEHNITPPGSFENRRQRRKREEIQQSKDAERSQRLQQEVAYEEYEHAAIDRFIAEELPDDEYRRLLAGELRSLTRMYRNMTREQLDDLARTAVRSKLKESGRFHMLSLEEFRRHHNSDQK
jgi:hypothetical protein